MRLTNKYDMNLWETLQIIKKHISKLIKIEPSDSQAWNGMNTHFQCHECFIAWDSVTGDRTDKYKLLTVDNDVMKKFMERLNSAK